MPIDPLKPYGVEAAQEPDVYYHRPWYTHWWGIVLIFFLGAVIVGGSVFGWRVYSYYQKIQTGELGPAIFQFSDKFTLHGSETGQTGVIPFFDVITADDPQLGPQDAPVTIVEFADFLCPYCAEEAMVVRSITSKYPNEVRFIFRDFPIDEMHPGASDIHIAGACANEQGKFWAFHDKIFQNQDNLNSQTVKAFAAQAGLNIADFDQCINSGKYTQEVANDVKDGRRAGVVGTPTLFFNGRKIEGAIPYNYLVGMIDAVLSVSK